MVAKRDECARELELANENLVKAKKDLAQLKTRISSLQTKSSNLENTNAKLKEMVKLKDVSINKMKKKLPDKAGRSIPIEKMPTSEEFTEDDEDFDPNNPDNSICHSPLSCEDEILVNDKTVVYATDSSTSATTSSSTSDTESSSVASASHNVSTRKSKNSDHKMMTEKMLRQVSKLDKKIEKITPDANELDSIKSKVIIIY